MLKVTGLQEASESPCIVKIDYYVPISFRSRSATIPGARLIQLGDSKTQLLELKFTVESLALRGFTLVGGEASTQGRLTGNGPSVPGLPIIALPERRTFSSTSPLPFLDIQTKVSFSCTDGQAEIRLGDADTFNRRIVHGRIQFLLLDDALVGFRVLDLTEEEQQTLSEYIARHSHQTAT